MVCTAVIHIIAVLLGAASVWSTLCLLSSFPLRRVFSGALQQACERLLDQAVCPSVHCSLLLYTLSTALYKIDLKRTSRGHLLAFSVTNQLYLDSAWGKVHKERQYLLCDQLIQLEKQTNCGGLEPFVGAEEEKAAFKAKYTVKIISLSLSP